MGFKPISPGPRLQNAGLGRLSRSRAVVSVRQRTRLHGQDSLGILRRYAREYGGVTRIWLGGRPALVLNDPKLIGEVLDSRADDFYKDSPRTALLPVITDNGLFIANGADWSAKREAHPFRMDGLREWLAAKLIRCGRCSEKESAC